MAIKVLAVIAAGVSSLSAAPPAQLDRPSFEKPGAAWRDLADAEQRCRDRVNEARAAAGEGELERKPAGPERAPLLYAMDTRIDGCSVLVPANDPADIRPVPEAKVEKIIPAG